jgi:hypothetical protein
MVKKLDAEYSNETQERAIEIKHSDFDAGYSGASRMGLPRD